MTSTPHPPGPSWTSCRARAKRWATLTGVIIALCWSSTATAKPTLGVELRLGLSVPFSRYVQTTLVQLNRPVGDNVEPELRPYIGDATNNPSSVFTILATFREFEFSFSRVNFNWGKGELRYRGNKAARVIDDGALDDADVRYTRLSPTETVDVFMPSDDLTLWTFDVGYHFYLQEGSRIEIYVPVGTGVAVAHTLNRGSGNIGAHVWLGFTTDLNVSSRFALLLDLRYNFIMTGNIDGTQRGSQNASVADESVFSALMSTMHYGTVSLGFRLDFDI